MIREKVFGWLNPPAQLDGAGQVVAVLEKLLEFDPALSRDWGEKSGWQEWLDGISQRAEKTDSRVLFKKSITKNLCAESPLWALLWQVNFCSLGNAELRLLAAFLYQWVAIKDRLSSQETELGARALRLLLTKHRAAINWSDIVLDLTGLTDRSRLKLGKNCREAALQWPVNHLRRNYLQRLAIFFGDVQGAIGKTCSKGVPKSRKRYFIDLRELTRGGSDDETVRFVTPDCSLDETGDVAAEDVDYELVLENPEPILRAELGSLAAVYTTDNTTTRSVSVGRKIKKTADGISCIPD
ncbi:hypothetical protein ACFQMB_07325 [Pseudobowmanella zhangzhouensis]|uniref:hypothetical protein n=1 Tax=Pseudobowmanella zhangzhouensis TaxID=1537679 RepID=UPI00360A7E50